MKQFKILTCFILIALFFASCNKASDANKCGDSNAAGIAIHTYSDYKKYLTTVTTGDASAYDNYGVVQGVAVFREVLDINNNMCTAESVGISGQLNLRTSDPNLHIRLSAAEGSGTGGSQTLNQTIAGTSATPVSFEYLWQNTSNVNGNIEITYTVSFPTHLSWSADSAYFFGNLDTWTLTAAYKKPA